MAEKVESGRIAKLGGRKHPFSVITLFIFASTLFSYTEEVIEDLIDIAELNIKITATIEGNRQLHMNIRQTRK